MAKKKVPTQEPGSMVVTVVLQWLTYAFWGWSIVAFGFLLSLGAQFLIGESTKSIAPEVIPSAIAGTVVLFAIASICDIFYSRREEERKTGFSLVLTVLHSVLAGLVGVGVLIAIMLSVIRLITSLNPSVSSEQIFIITGIGVLVLLALLMVRISWPFARSNLRLLFRIVFLSIGVSVIALAIFGPGAQNLRMKDDAAVRQTVSAIPAQVDRYVTKEKVLPASLDDIADNSSFTGNESTLKSLAERQLITYMPNIKQPVVSTSTSLTNKRSTTTFYYELCATYKYANKQSSKAYSSYNTSGLANVNGAGKTCKTLTATYTERDYDY